jgi:RES domain-containing protein
MRIYRLSKQQYANDLSGRGAEKTGGRWNSKGTPMVYCGESRALCTTEIAVHTPLGNIPENYCLTTISIPDEIAIKLLSAALLPDDWKTMPHANSTQAIGDRFISENNYVILKVPSVVVPGEYNYLLNPLHPDFRQIAIETTEPFEFDRRLFVR